MSYSLQAEGLKGMNIQRLIIVGHGWFSNTVEGAASPPCVVLGLLLRLQKIVRRAIDAYPANKTPTD